MREAGGQSAVTGMAENCSTGIRVFLTQPEQMTMVHRVQGCPRQNKPNFVFMQEKQSLPWDTAGGRPSNSALVSAVLMCLTSSKLRFKVWPEEEEEEE